MIAPYLTFNGNCKEAMLFYQSCLGGNLHIQTIGESPLAEKMPSKMKNSILHATLDNKQRTITGSDMAGNKGLQHGNSVSILLNCNSQNEIQYLFNLLSDGGLVVYPLETTFFGATIGNLTDKFGIHWMLHYNPNDSK